MAARRHLSIAIAIVVAVAVLGGRWGCSACRERDRERDAAAALGRAAQAFADLEACLLGEPLAHGEDVHARYRAIELTALRARGPDAMGPGEATWPGRCARYGEQLAA